MFVSVPVPAIESIAVVICAHCVAICIVAIIEQWRTLVLLFPVRRWRVLTPPFLSSFSFSSSTALGCRNAALHFPLPFLFFFLWSLHFRANQALQHFVVSTKEDQITHAQDLTTKKAFLRSAAAISRSILQLFFEKMGFLPVCCPNIFK